MEAVIQQGTTRGAAKCSCLGIRSAYPAIDVTETLARFGPPSSLLEGTDSDGVITAVRRKNPELPLRGELIGLLGHGFDRLDADFLGLTRGGVHTDIDETASA